jgi:hypothetical protein
MTIATAKKTSTRMISSLLALFFLAMTAGCGSGNNNTTNNVGLFGNWNIVMFPTGSSNASYVFALAISQEGGNNYSGSPIPYTGSTPVPSNQCINTSVLRSTATTNSSNNFTMTVTDTSTQTVITMTGSLATDTQTLSGTYTNPASTTCSSSSGTFSMTPQ